MKEPAVTAIHAKYPQTSRWHQSIHFGEDGASMLVCYSSTEAHVGVSVDRTDNGQFMHHISVASANNARANDETVRAILEDFDMVAAREVAGDHSGRLRHFFKPALDPPN